MAGSYNHISPNPDRDPYPRLYQKEKGVHSAWQQVSNDGVKIGLTDIAMGTGRRCGLRVRVRIRVKMDGCGGRPDLHTRFKVRYGIHPCPDPNPNPSPA